MITMMRTKPYLMVLGVFLLLAGCSKKAGDYHYETPLKAEDGWEVSPLDSVGMNAGPLTEMMNRIAGTSGHNLHSILIFRNGKLAFEEYFNGYLYNGDPPGTNGDYVTYDRETDHFLASVSKSVTSVIFGAALKAGYIESVDKNVIDLLPEYADILTGEKANITLAHMLTMSSGLAWDESSAPYGDPANDVTALFNSDDPIAYILSKEMVSSPGEEFLYNSGTTNVLGAIVQKYTEKSLLAFGNEVLFDPLHIQGGLWQQMAGGYFFASGGIFLRPRELAKIGYLFLNHGYWGEHQVITEEWISESVREHISTGGKTLSPAHAYGYQWWIEDFVSGGKKYSCFLAAGWGDQYMFIFPEQELIVVFNSGNYQSPAPISPFTLMKNYILPSLTE
jgi:CubicO group peptidase (beta-lactamase class C family)